MLVLLCSALIGTPASAIEVNGVDYVLLARQGILMGPADNCPNRPTQSPILQCMNVNGNIGVSSPNGRVQIGVRNTINGTVTAHNVILGSFSSTSTCMFNVRSGSAPSQACETLVSPLPAATLPLVAAWPPGPLGAVPADKCVKAAPNVTLAAGSVGFLAPGCYRDVRLNADSTMNLGPGFFVFRNLRLLSGAVLNGGGNVVNVQGLTITEREVEIRDVFIQTPAFEGPGIDLVTDSGTKAIEIGSRSTLKDVILYAPGGTIVLHLGISAKNFEAIADFISVDPIVITSDVDEN